MTVDVGCCGASGRDDLGGLLAALPCDQGVVDSVPHPRRTADALAGGETVYFGERVGVDFDGERCAPWP